MPVEIIELVVRAEVREPTEASSPTEEGSETQSPEIQEDLVAEKVVEIIKRKKER